MTHSEMILARILRELEKWRAEQQDHEIDAAFNTVSNVEITVATYGWIQRGTLTRNGTDLVRRAEQAGVFTEAERIAGALHVIAGNNNQPRVILQGAGVELVRSRRALADMTLPVNVKDAQDIRMAAIRALCEALGRPASAPSMMTRDLQEQASPTPLDPMPELLDEVEAHRETKRQLAEAEQRIEELEAELVGLTAQGKP